MNREDSPSREGSRWRQLHRPRSAWFVAGGLAAICFAASAAVSTVRWPQPVVHDEFSYLLAGDTFAHGRLTNPPHPYWQHFETFHVIQQPTYASKYPPGQGIVLAVGQALTGQAIVGVWLLSAAAAAATYWMLLAWTTRRYAALGALLWAAHPGFLLVWGQSYWGGALAYLGGALVFGAALRMQRRATVRDAVAMAAGAVVLALSRPFEGLVYCVLVGSWVVVRWHRTQWPSRGDFLLKLALPQAVILGLCGGALASYHQAVTGDALTFPYAVHERTYGQCPLFAGGAPAAKPDYRHAVIEDFHSGWELDWHRRQSTLSGWVDTKLAASRVMGGFYLTPIVAVLLLLTRPWRLGRLRPVVVVGALTLAAALVVTWNLPHYIAPLAPLLLVACAAGVRRADALGRMHLNGFRPGTALVLLQAAFTAAAAARHGLAPAAGFGAARAAIAAQLSAEPERALVFVRYGEHHNPHQEWVYNDADIDAAKVVWARCMDGESDEALRRYFRDRKAWLLEPDSRRLVPLETDGASYAAHSAQ